jgi:hypothetical protein
VFPRVSNVIWAKLGTSDKVLCTILGTCYIETNSLDVCVMLTEYIQGVSKVKVTGGVDEVRNGIETVYRQRLSISRLLDIVGIASKLNISIVLTKDLFITDTLLSGVSILTDTLNQYLMFQDSSVQEKGLNWWLTAVTITQFVSLCRAYKIPIFYQYFEEAFSIRGLWYRAPLLCSSFVTNPLRAPVVLLEEQYTLAYSQTGNLLGSFLDKPFSLCHIEGNFEDSLENMKLSSANFIRGFSGRNLVSDIRKGLIFKNESA